MGINFRSFNGDIMSQKVCTNCGKPATLLVAHSRNAQRFLWIGLCSLCQYIPNYENFYVKEVVNG